MLSNILAKPIAQIDKGILDLVIFIKPNRKMRD
jgi:hypothetical protein